MYRQRADTAALKGWLTVQVPAKDTVLTLIGTPVKPLESTASIEDFAALLVDAFGDHETIPAVMVYEDLHGVICELSRYAHGHLPLPGSIRQAYARPGSNEAMQMDALLKKYEAAERLMHWLKYQMAVSEDTVQLAGDLSEAVRLAKAS